MIQIDLSGGEIINSHLAFSLLKNEPPLLPDKTIQCSDSWRQELVGWLHRKKISIYLVIPLISCPFSVLFICPWLLISPCLSFLLCNLAATEIRLDIISWMQSKFLCGAVTMIFHQPFMSPSLVASSLGFWPILYVSLRNIHNFSITIHCKRQSCRIGLEGDFLVSPRNKKQKWILGYSVSPNFKSYAALMRSFKASCHGTKGTLSTISRWSRQVTAEALLFLDYCWK